jgi:acetyltransferase-like isoleucine patch superfamily enzyme
MNWLRYSLRGLKIVRRGTWAVVTTRYTRFWFRANGVRLGKDLLSNGLPELELSLSGNLTIGEGVELQNGVHYNMIGRQQKCFFVVGKGASLTVGDHVGLSGTAIVCHERITIGNHVQIGMNCVIYDTDFHDLDHRKRALIPEDYSGVVTKPVTIGNGVFIGAHATILKGVTIGDKAIVGACSVVAKSVPAGEIWAGNPARYIGPAPAAAETPLPSFTGIHPVRTLNEVR